MVFMLMNCLPDLAAGHAHTCREVKLVRDHACAVELLLPGLTPGHRTAPSADEDGALEDELGVPGELEHAEGRPEHLHQTSFSRARQ